MLLHDIINAPQQIIHVPVQAAKGMRCWGSYLVDPFGDYVRRSERDQLRLGCDHEAAAEHFWLPSAVVECD
jgi:hypothetical protein